MLTFCKHLCCELLHISGLQILYLYEETTVAGLTQNASNEAVSATAIEAVWLAGLNDLGRVLRKS
jgi:hypothetical protein